MARADTHIRRLYKAIRHGAKMQSPHAEISIQHKKLGEVNFKTGEVVVCDPFVMWNEKPFEQKITSGKYPVVLCIASIRDDQRIAASILKLRDEKPTRWQMATKVGQEVRKLKEGSIFGFGVDSGCAGIMDASVGRHLEKRLGTDKEDRFYFQIVNQMETAYVHTRDWTIFDFGKNQSNFAVFSSGYGDGFYASYWGYNKEGQVICLVTDFGVIESNWVK